MEKKKDEALEAWLSSQKEPTKTYYRAWFAKFSEFTGLTGDEILEQHAHDKAGTWEAKVLSFKNWLLAQKKEKKLNNGKKTLGEYSATAMSMAVRGFFSYHRKTLQFRPAESKRISEKSRVTEDYRFSLADLKKFYEVGDLEERYVVCAGKSFGLRAGDFLALTRGDLEPFVNAEPPVSIGQIKTQKEHIPAYPFIDSDAQPVVKLMLEKLAREGRTKPDDRILDFSQTIQLSRVLKRLVVNAGIEVGNKEVRFHCLRKFLCDHLSSFMSESKWKQIVGKKISEGAYISPDELRKDYLRAMAETCFQKEQAVTKEVADLKAKFEEFKKSLTPEELEAGRSVGIIRGRKAKFVEKAAKRAQKADDCPDGSGHCEEFKQIPESELLQYLKDGWAIIKELSCGQCIVKR